jgi:hypothetical protein
MHLDNLRICVWWILAVAASNWHGWLQGMTVALSCNMWCSTNKNLIPVSKLVLVLEINVLVMEYERQYLKINTLVFIAFMQICDFAFRFVRGMAECGCWDRLDCNGDRFASSHYVSVAGAGRK